jgi:hypothetical protein
MFYQAERWTVGKDWAERGDFLAGACATENSLCTDEIASEWRPLSTVRAS